MSSNQILPPGLRETIEHELSCQISNLELINGKGEVNIIYKIESTAGKFILRLNDSNEYDRFKKEVWCYEYTAKVGVNGPRVFMIGTYNDKVFMVLEYIEGGNGKGIVSTPGLWRELGSVLRIIHRIPVRGFGEKIEDITSGTLDDWQVYIRSNLAALDDEYLIAKLIINDDSIKNIKEKLKLLLRKDFVFGLNHGDFSLANTIANDKGVYVIDWGSAEAHIVPHHDFSVILDESLDKTSQEFEAFIDGYGVTLEEFRVMSEEIETLQLLESLDKLRWALDKAPHRVDHYTRQFSKFVERL
ncbi:MAG TPA: aminoglycoside phosphotransferase family protein [Verrucomicrobiae bacterium]|nr:aminoglycoside phosphotransferase family protein [Verrucomicrobiae bacterium]